MSEEIRSMAKVKVHHRCPRCSSLRIKRKATEDETSLWDMTERCIMCKWTRTISNVKAGM
jgi:hypothetical protein